MVLNEYGGVEGLITARDVIGFVFGELTGEVFDTDQYRMDEHNTYEVPGDMKLGDFNNLTNFGITDPRMTTVGGVAFRHFDRVPEIGDSVVVDGATITVLAVDCHRIDKLRVMKGKIKSSEQDADGAKKAPDLVTFGLTDHDDKAAPREDDG